MVKVVVCPTLAVAGDMDVITGESAVGVAEEAVVCVGCPRSDAFTLLSVVLSAPKALIIPRIA